MKKWMKVSLIAALSCIGLGIVITVGAAAAGGTEEVKKLAENGELSIGNDRSCWRPGGTEWNTEVKGGGASGIVELTAEQTETVRHLEMDIAGGRLEIRRSEDDTIRLEQSGKVDLFRAGMEGNTFVISSRNRLKAMKETGIIQSIASDVNREKICYTLYLPEGKTLETVGCDIGAGAVWIDGLSCEELDLDIGAGSIQIQDAETGQAFFDVSAGELVYEGSVSQSMEADCSMGSITAVLPGTQQDYNYTVDVSMGEIQIGQNSYSGLAEELNVDNDAACDVDLDCSMGEIILQFE